MFPRLSSLSEKVKSVSLYPSVIEDIKSKALKSNAYWTFDMNIIDKNNAEMWCNLENDIVICKKWRLVGLFIDVIMLAKLLGNFYQPHNKEIVLPNFTPEETYWINFLQLVKITSQPDELEEEEEIVIALPPKITLKPFWETSCATLCKCCADKPSKKSFFNRVDLIPTALPGTLSPVSI